MCGCPIADVIRHACKSALCQHVCLTPVRATCDICNTYAMQNLSTFVGWKRSSPSFEQTNLNYLSAESHAKVLTSWYTLKTSACAFSLPFWIQDIQQLLSIHLLRCCEHHHFKQLSHPFQEFKQERPLPDSHRVLSGIELDSELKVCCVVSIKCGMHLNNDPSTTSVLMHELHA